ncbi:MAG: dipicolinate synthase subunit B [Clostridia bacterium]|nr:dipicolinate synthase subunit B [Clostridia bacterium]
MVEPVKIGFALTGSFCTFDKVMQELEKLAEKYDVSVIMSKAASSTDTRFGTAESFIKKAERISGKAVIHEISAAEPIGPKKLFDALVIAPCTGNTLAKLACGITDTPPTMAAKAHLRNERPLIIAPSTNDGLGANAKNIGLLLNTTNIYFVPFGQDDPINKHKSLVADFTRIGPAVEDALKGRQLQPILL